MKLEMHALMTERLSQVLVPVLSQQQPLDKALAALFATEKYSVKEQANQVQLAQQLMRGLSLYEALAGCRFVEQPAKVWAVLASWHGYSVYGQLLPDLTELQGRAAALPAHILQGCPDWLEQLGQQELGDAWALEREALWARAPRYVRANWLKISTSELQQALLAEGIESRVVAGVPTALEILSDCALFQSRAFKQGWFEQQDAGSQQVADALHVKPAARVIDACAGAGGKSLALAARMAGKGRLLAMDVEEWKLATLQQRARRAGAGNIETRLISSSKTIKRLADKADFLLLDVPCSGSGVLRRNPDAKWQAPMRLAELKALQRDILSRYSKMLAIGGELLYATCSIFPSENQHQVQWFLQQRPDFVLEQEQTISPAATGFDGFYWARLRRQAVITV
ncbi:RsmB/NOP family class I SAM-dependent RNA methyltransferase [Rheinheimera sp.]|uniref:RsmB/NOP family class I SAM-dependent RNA methyltransferase n=1 Tax=Rheinheimera sp. TaxID=1869214 RepID=UPI00307D88E7